MVCYDICVDDTSYESSFGSLPELSFAILLHGGPELITGLQSWQEVLSRAADAFGNKLGKIVVFWSELSTTQSHC